MDSQSFKSESFQLSLESDDPPHGGSAVAPRALPVLPENYYLEHFRDFMRSVERTYSSYLADTERHLVERFFELTDDEQRMFARVSNRMGTVFMRSSFRYPEIRSIPAAIDGLIEKGFLCAPESHHLETCLDFLGKEQLFALLSECLSGESWCPKRTWPKVRLQTEARERVGFAHLKASSLYAELVLRQYVEELRYLCFLAFGDMHSDLKLYTLRDLGIRRSNSRPKEFTQRFASTQEARSEFFFRTLREELRGAEPAAYLAAFSQRESWPPVCGNGAMMAREKILLEAAHALQQAKDLSSALAILSEATGEQATQKRIRLLHALGKSDAVRAELQTIFDEPLSAELLQFAEEFTAMKFGQVRKSSVTRALEQAETLRLNGRYRGRPEQGVVDYFCADGVHAFHVENDLWLTLFGCLFWDELFEGEAAALHSEFERLPRDLILGTFYDRNQERLEQKVASLREPGVAERILRDTVSRQRGKPNGLFSWGSLDELQLIEFINACAASKADPCAVLLRMAKDFERSKRGYPDLLVLQGGRPVFIEVKSFGDKLQHAQLRQLRFLSDCGFETRIIRVEWEYDPHQVYVVVDVETTGVSAERNRVTEIGALKIINGEVVDRFTTLVNPQCRIPSRIVALTGITNQMVAEAPTFPQIAKPFLDFVGDAIFVGHNVRFDHSFISAEYRRFGFPFRRPTLCTCASLRRTHPGLPSYSLKNLCTEFGVPLRHHHRALADAEATGQLLLMVLQRGDEVAAGQSTPSVSEDR
ncbi:MAG: exonuclease domain-containing protein [Bdellovibrionota bacterium]